MARSPSTTPKEQHSRTGRKIVPTFKVVTEAAEKVKDQAKAAKKKLQKKAAGAKSKLAGLTSKPQRQKQTDNDTDDAQSDKSLDGPPRRVKKRALVVSDDESSDSDDELKVDGPANVMDLASDPENGGQSDGSDEDGEGSETEEVDEEDGVDSETELGVSAIRSS